MKNLALTMFCLLYSTTNWAQNTQNTSSTTIADTETQIQVVNRPEILGLWGMDIPTNRQCIEYYNFRGGSELVIQSGKEWSVGQFQYQAPDNRSEQLPALLMHIQYDNNEVDCSGLQNDQSGEIQQFFVKWVSPRQIEFCDSDKGEKCFAKLNKKLP